MTHRAINNWKIIISLIMTLATFKHFFFLFKKINFETKTMLSPLILLIRNFFFYILFLCVAYTYIHIRKKEGWKADGIRPVEKSFTTGSMERGER